MRLIIIGSEGNIGRRLKAAFPNTIGVDLRPTADIVTDLTSVDYAHGALAEALRSNDSVVHLAGESDPAAPDDAHWRSVVIVARLFAACAEAGVPRVVVASSDWAEPKDGTSLSAYDYSKRVTEELAAMYSIVPGRTAVALRVGWVPRDRAAVSTAPDWLAANYWDDARLILEFRRAFGF